MMSVSSTYRLSGIRLSRRFLALALTLRRDIGINLGGERIIREDPRGSQIGVLLGWLARCVPTVAFRSLRGAIPRGETRAVKKASEERGELSRRQFFHRVQQLLGGHFGFDLDGFHHSSHSGQGGGTDPTASLILNAVYYATRVP